MRVADCLPSFYCDTDDLENTEGEKEMASAFNKGKEEVEETAG